MLYQEKSPYSTAVFALGCFWCVEEIFEHIKGVHEVISGYSGGHTANPTYEQVGMGRTGHAESILVKYDPALVSYEELLKVYFKSGDITQVNGQGPDDGDQYRSIIFYDSENQRDIIQNEIKKLENSGEYKDKISIEIKPFDIFYVAEDYHQDFVKLNPNENYVKAVSKPRFVKAITSFKDLLKSDD
ncbi:MAG: peptide-methionine (S)-S-oxide reductase MsrA [Saprospiraceae bacterium]|nr:peptide-methionine (S)-S-oxide reductase MsrA [Saprospiraceae bacterium]